MLRPGDLASEWRVANGELDGLGCLRVAGKGKGKPDPIVGTGKGFGYQRERGERERGVEKLGSYERI